MSTPLNIKITEEFIAADMNSFLHSRNNSMIDPSVVEIIADNRLEQHVSLLMKEKLAKSRAKGKGGWWREEDCTIEHLKSLLQEAMKKGDMVDVINFAAMIQIRTIMEKHAGRS